MQITISFKKKTNLNKRNNQPPVSNSTFIRLSSQKVLCLNAKNKVTFWLNECASSKATFWVVNSDLQIVSTKPYSATIKPISKNTTSAFSRITATLANGKTVVKEIEVLGKPSITFKDTSLRDVILAGVSPTIYPNITISKEIKFK